MRTRSQLGALVLCLGLAGVPQADAAAPALAATTVISGSGVGAMKVRVPRDATLSLRPTANWSQGEAATFRGAGRLLAVALVATPGDDETWLMKSSICSKPGCTSKVRPYHGLRITEHDIEHEQTRLAAGTYTLYWFADGSPASVTLRFGGLRGRTSLRPPRIGGTQWTAPEQTNTVDPTTGVGVRTYDGDTEVLLPRRGLLLSVLWIAGDNLAAQSTLCLVPQGSGFAPPGVCEPPSTGMMRSASITCPLCFVTETVMPGVDQTAMIGMFGWTLVTPGTYTMWETTQFAGFFGSAGTTALVVPYV